MLIFINLIYYHLSPNECYLRGPNASFDLGREGRREEGRQGRRKNLFRNTILITESEHKIRSFVYLTSKRWKPMGKMRL